MKSCCICVVKVVMKTQHFSYNRKIQGNSDMPSTPKLECQSVTKFCYDRGHIPTQTFQMMEKMGIKCSTELVFKWWTSLNSG